MSGDETLLDIAKRILVTAETMMRLVDVFGSPYGEPFLFLMLLFSFH